MISHSLQEILSEMNVLIIEDERNVSTFVRSHLELEGFQCSLAYDGAEGLRQFQAYQPDIVLLDLNLPKMDGLEVCTQIRQSKSVKKDPYILMMTGRCDEFDRIIGYSTGADDYIPKPFNPKELVVRLRAVLRRNLRHKPEQRIIETPHFLIDQAKREVLIQQDDSEIQHPELSPVEFDLLVQMAAQPGRVWSRTGLLDAVKGVDFIGDDRAIDTYIRRLRNKITPPGMSRERYIKTHFRVGYSFEDR